MTDTYMDYKLKTVSTTLETSNNQDAEITYSSPHKRMYDYYVDLETVTGFA